MRNEEAIRFCEKVAVTATDVLRQLTGKEYSIESEGIASMETLTHAVTLKGRVHPEKELVLRYGSDMFKMLGEALLGEPIADESTAEAAETVIEVWRQVVGRANTTLREELGGDELEVVGATGSDGLEGGSVNLRMKGEVTYTFRAELSQGFLSTGEENREVPAGEAGAATASACDHRNLDLLLEIPLSVTLRFGERRMALRNILELSSGAVLELDRQADEPVDLCLDERVIARGQVVVVDGCYGLRVTQICRPVDYGFSAGVQA